MPGQTVRRAVVVATALLGLQPWSGAATREPRDVVVYGGSSAAVIAAVQARRMGRSVIVVSPDRHLGGLSSGGLGWTDTGNKAVIGGLARDFYHRVWKHYQRPEAWRWQERAAYGDRGQGHAATDGESRTMWVFEPHVAERIFEDLVTEHGIEVVRDEWLDRERGVRKDGERIVSITTLAGGTYPGAMFIDATYEGDLMAAAGVGYHVGREANAVYGEEHNGVQVGVLHHRHHFGVLKEPVSAYRVPGDPTSGVLPRISTAPVGEFGAGDRRVQAFCFRMCLTNVPENRLPFPKPAGYDAAQYELLLRTFAAGWDEFFNKFDPLPNGKTDTNNHGPFSFDNIGFNHDYPEASYERRREIVAEHVTYQQGLLWFVANDPRVPKAVQEELRTWGLPKDEFTDNGHWSHQLYVREARRMVGGYVMTENELRKKRPTPDPVGMGSYTIDSHNVQRYVTPEGFVQNEGDIGVSAGGPYAIAYGAIVPRKGECGNLLVPVAVSASHIAYGSIRMEPVFMILGQSAATAAALAIDGGTSVQDVPYDKLRARLLADGQVLDWTRPLAPAGRQGADVRVPADSTPLVTGLQPTDTPGVGPRTRAAQATGCRFEVLNRGMRGYGVGKVLQAWPRLLRQGPAPDVVVLMIGTNDMVNSAVLTPMDTFSERYESLVDALLASAQHVIVATLPPCVEELLFRRHRRELFADASPNERIRKANAVIREVARRKGCALLDVDSLFAPGTYEEGNPHGLLVTAAASGRPDGVHPNARGARRIGEAAAERIESLGLAGGTIVCLGDSITHGGGLEGEGTAEGETYPAVVRQILDGSSLP